MAATTFANMGIDARWTYRESGWKPGMDDNLLIVDTHLHCSVIDHETTAPPGGESDGDRYIIPSGATGDWSGKTDQIACYVTADTDYTYYTPKEGWRAYVESLETMLTYNGSNWVYNGVVPYVAKTATYTITLLDYIVECTANTFTVTLPALSTVPYGRIFIIQNSGAGTITLDGDASETIDGATTQAIAQYNSITVARGTEWLII